MKKNLLFLFLTPVFAFLAGCGDSGKGEEDVYPTSVEVTNAVDGKITIEKGKTFQAQAVTNPAGFDITFSNGGSSVFTVNTSGLITAVETGTGTLTVSTEGQSGKISKTYPVEVKDVLVTGITLKKGNSIVLNIDESLDVADHFEVVPADAPDAVEYVVDDTSVAKMEGSVLKFVAAGETTLIARALDGSGVESAEISVECIGAGEMSPKSSWSATASTLSPGAVASNGDNYFPTPAMAFDDNYIYGWQSMPVYRDQFETQWLLVDMKKINSISKITVHDVDNYSHDIEIYISSKNESGVLSDDPSFTLIGAGSLEGQDVKSTTCDLPSPVFGRYMLIKIPVVRDAGDSRSRLTASITEIDVQ